MKFHDETGSRINHSFCSFVPPYVLDHMAESSDSRVRRLAIDAIANASAIRAVRATLATMPSWAATPSPTFRKHRLVYDVKKAASTTFRVAWSRGERQKKRRCLGE